MHNAPEHLRNTVGKALGRIPSGVFVLSARHNDAASAMLVSWVQQAAFDPPIISAAIATNRPVLPLIEAGRRFALAVVGVGDTALLKRYARGTAPGKDPFADVATMQTPSGQMVPKSSLAWIDCEVIQLARFGADHDLLIAKVTDGAILRDGPSFVHVRGNGFHY